jgi:putative FmdB family regulatory protein
MPTYEFRCPKGHEFEKFFPSMTGRRRMKCPKCGLEAERLISGGAGLHFKGSGFYATDYKSPSTKTESDTPSESKSESKPDAKSESKPEKAAEKPKKPRPKDK